MGRTVLLVDGFNLYHALDEFREKGKGFKFRKYKWLDLAKLAKLYLQPKDELEDVYYFTALTTWDAEKVKRHQIMIRALRATGVKIVFGEFRPREKRCKLCKKIFPTHEEKKTDVNIAIHLFRLAYEDRYDKATLLTADSDLVPAIEATKAIFPAKQIGHIAPIGRGSKYLNAVCDYRFKMKESHLATSQFPDEIDLGNGVKLCRPASWK